MQLQIEWLHITRFFFLMCVLKGMKMNSCACLLDPKKILVFVVLVWSFGDGCSCEQIYKLFFTICQV
jgi:hypothetical protein